MRTTIFGYGSAARYEVLLVDEPLVVKYGGHPDQLSSSTWGLDRFRIRALEKCHCSSEWARAEEDLRQATPSTC